MEKFNFIVFFFLLHEIFLFPISAQLSPGDSYALFQVQKLLEYPEVLQWWTKGTNFCSLPPSPSLKIVCTNNRITELSIVGNKSSPSQTQKPNQAFCGGFSIDSLFTTLTRLSSLKSISLVNLGLWGSLPPKIKRLSELQVLNVSSNFISGAIPVAVASLGSLGNLVLGDNLFNGSVPDLSGMLNLDELNLGGNHLGPEFPSVGMKLGILVLRNNSFRSEIPAGIKNLYQLRQLDISSNTFVGPIPSFLLSLPSIQYLSLAQNKFSGALPTTTSCGRNLQFIDISHNLLIGKLPPCISPNLSNKTVISSWNCLTNGNPNPNPNPNPTSSSQQQHPYSYCNKEALAVKPPETKETGGDEKMKSRINVGLILGILGGVLFIAVASALVVALVIKRSESRRDEDVNHDRSVVAHVPPPSIPRRMPQTMRSAAIGLAPYRVFTLEEIENATNNFDPANFMGEGSQGKLYRGWLRDGSVVVVRCLKLKQKHSQQNLMQDLQVLSKLRHRHLVSVLGHCVVTSQDHSNTGISVFVVLENVSNGSLQDYLTDWRKKEMLKWPQRIVITIGVARGIQFLHNGVAPRIYGNFLKIDNVLLDDTLTAKVCSYKIPLQPEVGSESPLNASRFHSDVNAEKEDIYQLGIILLEVITGKLVASADELDELKLQLERSLAEGVSTLKDVTDPSIRGTFAYESLRTTVQFAVNCLDKDANKRPTIEDVLWNLQYSIQVQESWTSSTGSLSTHM